ncbi:hypothetical protein TSO221_14050 [Azospirillum sp. TSO22-1]|nr:hypothetical protein TSO221_14050 [Azospirillum sp. TSO22-1]
MPEALDAAGGLVAELARTLPPGLAARMLDPADADAMRALRRRVIETLDDPDHYRVAGEVGDFVLDHLNTKGVTVGLFLGSELVAYGALGLPGPGDHNRGRDLPLPEAELPLVAHLSSAMVDPALRGRGLHHRMIDWRIAVADRIGRRHSLTTVSPRNHRSWGHLAVHGVYPKRLIDVGAKGGGSLLRLLVHRDALAQPVFDPATASLVPVEEIVGRGDLFARGEQVWCRLDQGGRWFALFGRARAAAV